MQYEKGTVVKSVAGHDKGSFYVITQAAGELVYIADGKLRKLEKPKRKSAKHINATKTIIDFEGKSNKWLYDQLKTFNEPLLKSQGGN